MEKFLDILQVIMPIFVAIALGMVARCRNLMTQEEVRGLQQFVMKFGLPCVVFNSCLTAEMGLESVTSMVLVMAAILASTVWSFWARKKWFPYHNVPMMFAAQETGMLGIPLFMILFGAGEAYRMGVLDLAQAVAAYPVIAILSSDTGERLSAIQIAKKLVTSPLVLMSMLGLCLNLTGIGAWMNSIGVRDVITESAGFLTQPISAMMIFSVGYNFSMSGDDRKAIFQISGIHMGMFAVFCLLIQGALWLVPGVDDLTRWVILLYCALPCSYLSPGLGREKKDFALASGACSLLTLFSLAVFCVIAVLIA